MAKYKILIKESAIKELESVPKKSLKQIIKRIQSLADNPRPKGLHILTVLSVLHLGHFTAYPPLKSSAINYQLMRKKARKRCHIIGGLD